MPPKRKEDHQSKDGKKNSNYIGENIEELIFEDPFGDEFEEEDIEAEEIDNDEEDEDAMDEDAMDEDDNDENENDETEVPKQVWRPGIDTLEEGDALEYDPTAYVMYHSLKTEWPCLTFDILKDTLGDGRQRVITLIFLIYLGSI